MLKTVNTTAYFSTGSELYLFGAEESTVSWIMESEILKNTRSIHLFILEISQQNLKALSFLIRYLYEGSMNQDSSRINLYYPQESIRELLELQQISSQWYNLFVNLWDEIPVDGWNRPMEYMFYEEKSFDTHCADQKKLYSMEINLPDQGLSYVCAGSPERMLERGISYQRIYVTVHSQQEYEILKQLTKGKDEVRKHVYLSLSRECILDQKIHEDGFHDAAKEE